MRNSEMRGGNSRGSEYEDESKVGDKIKNEDEERAGADGARAHGDGQSAARKGRPRGTCEMESGGASAGSGGAAEEIGCGARGDAAADSLRTDAAVAVCVLSRRGDVDGVGSGRNAIDEIARAGVRRLSPVEFRRIRRAGSAAGV